jgi:hypothetical protein
MKNLHKIQRISHDFNAVLWVLSSTYKIHVKEEVIYFHGQVWEISKTTKDIWIKIWKDKGYPEPKWTNIEYI